jgi:Ca2+-binding EF-hand superfamily protein
VDGQLTLNQIKTLIDNFDRHHLDHIAVLEIWRFLDADRNGALTVDELEYVLTRLGDQMDTDEVNLSWRYYMMRMEKIVWITMSLPS